MGLIWMNGCGTTVPSRLSVTRGDGIVLRKKPADYDCQRVEVNTPWVLATCPRLLFTDVKNGAAKVASGGE